MFFVVSPSFAFAANEYAVFPMKCLNITQGVNGVYSHLGTKNIDCIGSKDGIIEDIHAPFTCKVVYKRGTVIVIESKEPVSYADGTVDYMCMKLGHDDDTSDLYEGKEIQQGEVFYQEGSAPPATGIHVELECAKGKYAGWIYNLSYDTWTLVNSYLPYDALFLESTTVVVNGLGYNWRTHEDFSFTSTNGQATITGYKGRGGDITIPKTLGKENNTVTSIGDWAFWNCTNLRSVTILSNVTSIGNGAFAACNNMTSITLPSSIYAIKQGTFNGCSRLTNIIIPSGVTSIGNNAFQNCGSLTRVTIQQGVRSIGENAFADCPNLTNITTLSSVQSIGNRAFGACSSLNNVTLSSNLSSIGQEVFSQCSSLTKITIPNSVTSIGMYAFWNCNSLDKISIPSGVKSVAYGAFLGCSGLTSIKFYSMDTNYPVINNSGDTIPKKATIFGYNTSTTASAYASNFGRRFEIIYLSGAPYINTTIACPVDVTISNGDSKLSSDPNNLILNSDFGELYILGENNDIKEFILVDSNDYDIKIKGTDAGTMDYYIQYYDENNNLGDERVFENVPINNQTLITTGSDNSGETVLSIDNNGDGQEDTTWVAEGPNTTGVEVDGTPPLITISEYKTAPTNQDITVSASVDKGILNETSHTFTENGSFEFIATDEAGNSISEIITITNIDKIPPEIYSNVNDYDVLPIGTVLEFNGTDPNSSEPVIISAKLVSGTIEEEIPCGYEPATGVYKLTITATDVAGNTTSKSINIVIYDPEGGFVTGGGWINSPAGSYINKPELTGKATFGFVSKYLKGATVPTGQTEFKFEVANMKFYSSNYQWLVVAGSRAQFKGTGTINGIGEYGFLLTAIDGDLNNDSKADKFRIKIWDISSDKIIYDNQIATDDAADLTNQSTVIGGGSIVIHK